MFDKDVALKRKEIVMEKLKGEKARLVGITLRLGVENAKLNGIMLRRAVENAKLKTNLELEQHPEIQDLKLQLKKEEYRVKIAALKKKTASNNVQGVSLC